MSAEERLAETLREMYGSAVERARREDGRRIASPEDWASDARFLIDASRPSVGQAALREALGVAYNNGWNDGKEGLPARKQTFDALVLALSDSNLEAAIDEIIEAHNVEHGESCDCPIGLAIEEYEAVIRG